MAEPAMSARVARQIFLRSMAPTLQSDFTFDPQLANAMEDLYLGAGAIIYRKGEAPEMIYFIVSGTVHLIGDGDQPPTVMGPRSVIGIIDANLERPRARTAITVTDAHLLRLPADDYIELLEDNFEQLRSVLYFVGGGLRTTIAELGEDGGFEPPADDAYKSGAEIRPLNPIERMLALRAVPAFATTSVQALAVLLEKLEDVRVPEGDLAIRPGGKNGSLLIVARGVVELERETPPLKARFGPRSIVGGISTLGEDLKGAKLRAVTPALMLRLREEDLIDVIEDHFDLARSLLRHINLERERLMALKHARSRKT